MTKNSSLDLEKRLEMLMALGSDNPDFLEFLKEAHYPWDIRHIDEKCAIFSLEGDTSRSLKYVVDPETKKKISPFLQGIVLRGLKNQMLAQGIPGVQILDSSTFYKNIPGLLGPFGYLEGFNLARPYPFFLANPDCIFHLFQEQLDKETITGIHAREIIHRDVKPGNIVYKEERLYLIDWSISGNFMEVASDVNAKIFLGTRKYMSFAADRSKDFYALGLSFAKVLQPDIVLPVYSKSFDFELDAARKLQNTFGSQFKDYFQELIYRPPEDGSSKENTFSFQGISQEVSTVQSTHDTWIQGVLP